MVVTSGWRKGEKILAFFLMDIEIQICKIKNSRDLFHDNVNILILLKGTL